MSNSEFLVKVENKWVRLGKEIYFTNPESATRWKKRKTAEKWAKVIDGEVVEI